MIYSTFRINKDKISPQLKTALLLHERLRNGLDYINAGKASADDIALFHRLEGEFNRTCDRLNHQERFDLLKNHRMYLIMKQMFRDGVEGVVKCDLINIPAA